MTSKSAQWMFLKNYIFEISGFYWSKCTVECSICLTLILKSAQARCAYGTEILYILVFLQIVCGHAELFFFFCRTVFSAGNATGKLFHFDTKTCDLLEEISLGEGQINVLKYSPKVWQYQMWSFKFGDKVKIYWDRPQILKKFKSLE